MIIKIQSFTYGIKEVSIDDEDWNIIKDYVWCVDTRGYVVTNIVDDDGEKTTMALHRLLMGFPKYPLEVDHKNRNTLDNCRKNLRIATRIQQRQNQDRYSNNKSGYKGVSFSKGRNKYAAEIMINYKKKFLGRFDTAIEASQAYEKAAKELHGEFYYKGE